MYLLRLSCTALLLLALAAPTAAQSRELARSHYSELNLGYSIIQEHMREGYAYQPATLLPTTSLWLMGRFSVYAEGQIVYADIPTGTGEAFEFGLNMGFRYQQPIGPMALLTAAVGSGPHYITLQTESQAQGFIFSDNFELGLSVLPPGSTYGFNLRARFRHISNAGFKYPNLGIDNLFLILGIRREL